MQKKNRYTAVCIVLMLSGSLPAAEENGYLSITANDSAQIFVDSTFVGEDRISYFELPVGNHTVHAYNPFHLAWSDRGISAEINIVEGEHFDLDLRTKQEVRITSLPFASNVFDGKDLLGQTPLVYNRALISDRPLRIENKGYKDRSFNLVQGQSVYKVSLDPLEPGSKQSGVNRIRDNQYQIKWYREGLVVTSLVSSWASFYYKREADKSYTKYLRASDSREMIALYAETQKYDRISEIAIAVSVVTLGTYLYLLLLN